MTYINLLASLLLSTSFAASGAIPAAPINAPVIAQSEAPVIGGTNILEVPYFSQLTDISAAGWRVQGCGIASLAMLIEFYRPGSVSVDKLLKQGIAAGAYLEDAGWKHKDLGLLAGKYDLEGKSYDLSQMNMNNAFAQFKKQLDGGPVIASIFYKFNPKSTLPHLVVIKGISGDTVYYNDPSGNPEGEKISVSGFMKGWKKRFITVRDSSVS